MKEYDRGCAIHYLILSSALIWHMFCGPLPGMIMVVYIFQNHTVPLDASGLLAFLFCSRLVL